MLISLQILFLTSDIRFLENAIVVGETTYNCMYLSRTIWGFHFTLQYTLGTP